MELQPEPEEGAEGAIELAFRWVRCNTGRVTHTLTVFC